MADTDYISLFQHIDKEIYSAVVDWVDLAHGEFRLADITRDLNCQNNPAEIEMLKVVLRKLCHYGGIKQHKSRNGVFLKVGANLDKMQRVKNRRQPLDLWLPLGLHQKAVIIPGSLIIVAGISNAGKSTFMLNFTERNMERHKIRYISSEWTNEERDIHLEDFGANIDEWDKRVDFIAKKNTSEAFESYIDPEIINIIDYFESYDSYAAIAGELRDIADALDGGIAIVAMQKKAGAAHGYGGEGTVNRSQLYINLDINETDPHKRIATIRKLKKATVRKYNIERLSCEFEYDDKGRIVNQTGWGKVMEVKSKGELLDKYIEVKKWANDSEGENRNYTDMWR